MVPLRNLRETKEEEEGKRERIVNHDLMDQPLSPAARLFQQPTFNCCIVTIIGGGKEIDFDAVKLGLEVTIIRHPRFSSLLEETEDGEMKWVQTKVVLENHLVIPPLDTVTEFPDQYVEEYVARLTRTPLDKSKPLWELHLLNVKTSDAQSTAVFRLHHSLGDGMSLVSLLLACTRRSDGPDLLPTIPKQKPPVPAKGCFLPFLASVWMVFVIAWNSLVDVLLFIATSVFLKDTETPLKGPPGVGRSPKRFVHCTLSLDDIRTVKRVVNGTVNDVLLGITSAGLVSYLSRRYGKIHDGGGRKINIPANIRLRSTVVVNARPAPGVHDLADMMENGESHARWGNRLGYVIIQFPIVLKDNPLDYVLEAKAIIDRKKRSLESLITYASSTLMVRLFGIQAATHLAYKVLSNTTFSFSSVPGPIEEVQFFGNPIRYIAPSVYGHPQALTIHFQSYVNKVTLVVAVDEDVIPDPHQLCEDVTNALIVIKNATANMR